MLIGIALVTVLQFAFTYLPVLQAMFDTEPVPFADGLLIVAMGVALLVVVEAEKRLVEAFRSPGRAVAAAVEP